MPKKLKRCVKAVKKQGKDTSAAYAICNKSIKKENFKKYFENQNYYNDTLHPNFWDEFEFKEDVLKPVLKIVNDFVKDDDHVSPEMVEDIQLTGSLANYNYSEYSDLDVHILLDFADINEDESIVKRALDGKRFIWNLRHDIRFNGHEVELYFQDIHEPHVASGLFSLSGNRWIKKPKHQAPEVDHQDVQKKAASFKKELDLLQDALDNISDEKEFSLVNKRAKKLKDKLMKMRKEGLASKGEFSVENLAFKTLRNDETIAKLNDLIIKSYDLMFSKDDLEEKAGLDKWAMSLLHALYTNNPSQQDKPERYPAGI
tara:strand:- start:1596 stop:2540 length:945 start_codon:yes stop_codon:yes gene_type:complete